MTGSHRTSATYMRNHCTISRLICGQRARSMHVRRAGRPRASDVPESTGTEGCRARMCALAANADADEEVAVTEAEEAGWRCVLALALETDMSEAAAAEAEAEAEEVGVRAPDGAGEGWDGAGWRGKARECGGRRDSTMDRRLSHSNDVQPAKESEVSLGHTHVCDAVGAARC